MIHTLLGFQNAASFRSNSRERMLMEGTLDDRSSKGGILTGNGQRKYGGWIVVRGAVRWLLIDVIQITSTRGWSWRCGCAEERLCDQRFVTQVTDEHLHLIFIPQ